MFANIILIELSLNSVNNNIMESVSISNSPFSNYINASVSIGIKEINVSLKKLENHFYNYVLAIGNDIIYIGYSSNIYLRLIDHKQNKTFDKVILIEFNCKKIARLSEKDLIKKYKPKYNTQYL